MSVKLLPVVGMALVICTAGASAQDQAAGDGNSPQIRAQSGDMGQLGRTSQTAAGQVGERQSAAEMPFNAKPMTRVNNRIRNRIENRISNRIDKDYEPQQGTTSAIDVAAARARRSTAATIPK